MLQPRDSNAPVDLAHTRLRPAGLTPNNNRSVMVRKASRASTESGHDVPLLLDRAWEDVQKKTFTKWINSHLRGTAIENLSEDLRNGVKLIQLVETLTGSSVGKYHPNPRFRIQMIDNVNKALTCVMLDGVSLTNIGAEDIVDGIPKLLLGLAWRLVSRYSLSEISGEREGLKDWCRGICGPDLDIKDFSASWKDGRAFCALVNSRCPNLIELDKLPALDHRENCELAFETAEKHLGIPRLLDVTDIVDYEQPDERSVMTYVAQFFHAKDVQESTDESDRQEKPELEAISTAKPLPSDKAPDSAVVKSAESPVPGSIGLVHPSTDEFPVNPISATVADENTGVPSRPVEPGSPPSGELAAETCDIPRSSTLPLGLSRGMVGSPLGEISRQGSSDGVRRDISRLSGPLSVERTPSLDTDSSSRETNRLPESADPPRSASRASSPGPLTRALKRSMSGGQAYSNSSVVRLRETQRSHDQHETPISSCEALAVARSLRKAQTPDSSPSSQRSVFLHESCEASKVARSLRRTNTLESSFQSQSGSGDILEASDVARRLRMLQTPEPAGKGEESGASHATCSDSDQISVQDRVKMWQKALEEPEETGQSNTPTPVNCEPTVVQSGEGHTNMGLARYKDSNLNESETAVPEGATVSLGKESLAKPSEPTPRLQDPSFEYPETGLSLLGSPGAFEEPDTAAEATIEIATKSPHLTRSTESSECGSQLEASPSACSQSPDSPTAAGEDVDTEGVVVVDISDSPPSALATAAIGPCTSELLLVETEGLPDGLHPTDQCSKGTGDAHGVEVRQQTCGGQEDLPSNDGEQLLCSKLETSGSGPEPPEVTGSRGSLDPTGSFGRFSGDGSPKDSSEVRSGSPHVSQEESRGLGLQLEATSSARTQSHRETSFEDDEVDNDGVVVANGTDSPPSTLATAAIGPCTSELLLGDPKGSVDELHHTDEYARGRGGARSLEVRQEVEGGQDDLPSQLLLGEPKGSPDELHHTDECSEGSGDPHSLEVRQETVSGQDGLPLDDGGPLSGSRSEMSGSGSDPPEMTGSRETFDPADSLRRYSGNRSTKESFEVRVGAPNVSEEEPRGLGLPLEATSSACTQSHRVTSFEDDEVDNDDLVVVDISDSPPSALATAAIGHCTSELLLAEPGSLVDEAHRVRQCSNGESDAHSLGGRQDASRGKDGLPFDDSGELSCSKSEVSGSGSEPPQMSDSRETFDSTASSGRFSGDRSVEGSFEVPDGSPHEGSPAFDDSTRGAPFHGNPSRHSTSSDISGPSESTGLLNQSGQPEGDWKLPRASGIEGILGTESPHSGGSTSSLHRRPSATPKPILKFASPTSPRTPDRSVRIHMPPDVHNFDREDSADFTAELPLLERRDDTTGDDGAQWWERHLHGIIGAGLIILGSVLGIIAYGRSSHLRVVQQAPAAL